MLIRCALVIFTAAQMLSGCSGGTDRTGATVRVDLVAPSAEVNEAITAATQIGLVSVDGKGNVVPALASSWRITGDGRGAIFRLRPRRWPDGALITAGDVVASLRRIAAPNSRNPARPLLAALANGTAVLRGAAPAASLGVDAPLSDVVEIRAAGAMPGLLALLAQPGFVLLAPGSHPPQLGALRVVDVVKRPILLTPNPAAQATVAGRTSVALMPTVDPASAIARFAHQRTDLVVGGGMAGFDDARLLTAANVLRVEPAWGVYGYLIHSEGPLADARVRRALAMAIDRDDLGSRLFGVALPPVLGLVPSLPSEPMPAQPDWAIASPAARLDLAGQLLKAAGFSADHPLHVAISLPDAREHANIASEVASDWARIGVTTTLVVRSPAAYADALAHGRFELAVIERYSRLDSALDFLLPFACTRSYCSPGADVLIAAARTAPDPTTAAMTLTAAEATLVADTPMIPLFAPIRWALVAPYVTGWTSNPAGQHPLALLGRDHARAFTH